VLTNRKCSIFLALATLKQSFFDNLSSPGIDIMS
jgi:hypothetical protein